MPTDYKARLDFYAPKVKIDIYPKGTARKAFEKILSLFRDLLAERDEALRLVESAAVCMDETHAEMREVFTERDSLLTQLEGESADADKYCKECVALEEREGIATQAYEDECTRRVATVFERDKARAEVDRLRDGIGEWLIINGESTQVDFELLKGL